MNKALKIILGIVTLWPIFYIALFVVSFFLLSYLEMPSDVWSNIFSGILGTHIFTMAFILALVIIYIVHIFRNRRIVKETRALWAVVVLLWGIITMPIYWYLHIWRKPRENTNGMSSLES